MKLRREPAKGAGAGSRGAASYRNPTWLSVLGTLIASALVLPPLAWLLGATLQALLRDGLAAVDGVSLRLLGRSLQLALLATLIAAGLGVPYGWAAARCRLPGRGLWLPLSLLALLLPPYAGALAWSLFFLSEGFLNGGLLRLGWVRTPVSLDGSLPAAAAVLAFVYWPLMAWATAFAARSVPSALEDEVRLHLPDFRAALLAARPALLRALPAAGLLVFLLALADFGAPNSLLVTTYPVEIVNRFQVDRDPGSVTRLAAPLLLLVVPLVALQNRWLERTPVPHGEGGVRVLRSRPGAFLGGLWCLLVLGATALLPLGTLFAYSFPLSTYGDVWAESSDHFLNTLLSAGGGGLVAAGAALLYGWSGLGRRRSVLDTLLTLPYALPASVIGIAMIRILNRPGPLGDLYVSPGALVWTYAALFFPFALKSLQPGWGRVDPALLEEGRILGAGAWEQFRAAAWPVVRPYLLAGGGTVALLAAREIDATALLRVPGFDTAAFRIYDYLHFDPGPKVAALCVLLVLFSIGVAGGLRILARGLDN